MAIVTRKGETVETIGELPSTGSQAPTFTLAQADLSDLTLESLQGKHVVLNIFPSIDTPTCARSVREFNQRAASLDNTVVICVAADLPFAMKRFCGAEGIENVLIGSSFRSSFGKDYGVTFITGPTTGLLSRSVVVIDPQGQIIYTEQVPDSGQEPNYDAALSAI